MSEDRMIELLTELVKWTKVTSIPKVKEILEGQLPTPKEKLAYKYSNGTRTIRDVSELSGRDIGSLSKDWKQWVREGIAERIPEKRGDRARSLFSLEDFGIETPSDKAETKKIPLNDVKSSQPNEAEQK
jgi:hypothetical protein